MTEISATTQIAAAPQHVWAVLAGGQHRTDLRGRIEVWGRATDELKRGQRLISAAGPGRL
jgi:hypothetical protein